MTPASPTTLLRGWMALGAFVVAFLLLMGVQLGWTILAGSLAQQFEWSEPARQSAQFVGYPLGVFVLALCVFVFWPAESRLDLTELPRLPRSQLVCSPFLMLPLSVAIAGAYQLAGGPNASSLREVDVRIPWVTLLLGAVLLPAMSEEVLFRSWLGRRMIQWLGATGGIVVTSIVFSLTHLSPARCVATLLLGLALHWVYRHSGSLTLVVLLHAANNGLALATDSLQLSAIPLRLTVSSLVGSILLLRVIGSKEESLSPVAWSAIGIWCVAFGWDFVRWVGQL